MGLLSFPSNQVVHSPTSDSVAQGGWVHTVQRQRKISIKLFLLPKLLGEPAKGWSKPECPKTVPFSHLLRHLQETLPKTLHHIT